MPFQTDIFLIDDIQSGEIFEAVGATEGIGESGRVWVTMAGLIDRQDDIAAPGKFDGKTVLCFACINVAVDGENAGGRSFGGSSFRNVEQCADSEAVAAGKPDIFDLYFTEVRLDEVGEQSPDDDHHQGDCQNDFSAF